MIIRINGALLIDDKSWSNVKKTHLDTFFFGDHHYVPEMLGIAHDRDAQSTFDDLVIQTTHDNAAHAAAQVKAILSNHIFDLHALGHHLYNLMGMTN